MVRVLSMSCGIGSPRQLFRVQSDAEGDPCSLTGCGPSGGTGSLPQLPSYHLANRQGGGTARNDSGSLAPAPSYGRILVTGSVRRRVDLSGPHGSPFFVAGRQSHGRRSHDSIHSRRARTISDTRTPPIAPRARITARVVGATWRPPMQRPRYTSLRSLEAFCEEFMKFGPEVTFRWRGYQTRI